MDVGKPCTAVEVKQSIRREIAALSVDVLSWVEFGLREREREREKERERERIETENVLFVAVNI